MAVNSGPLDCLSTEFEASGDRLSTAGCDSPVRSVSEQLDTACPPRTIPEDGPRSAVAGLARDAITVTRLTPALRVDARRRSEIVGLLALAGPASKGHVVVRVQRS